MFAALAHRQQRADVSFALANGSTSAQPEFPIHSVRDALHLAALAANCASVFFWPLRQINELRENLEWHAGCDISCVISPGH